jgi:hypothetical protein
MKAVVQRVAASRPIAVEIVDISGDPQLEARRARDSRAARQWKKAAKYRVSEEELLRI